jgi:hypothetical protein
MFAPVMHGDGPHAVESGERVRTPSRERVKNHLGVSAGPALIGGQVEFRRELDVVVDPAVEGQYVPPVPTHHRLPAMFRHVEHGEAIVPHPDAVRAIDAIEVGALSIRTAMALRLQHSLKPLPDPRSIRGDDD